MAATVGPGGVEAKLDTFRRPGRAERDVLPTWGLRDGQCAVARKRVKLWSEPGGAWSLF